MTRLAFPVVALILLLLVSMTQASPASDVLFKGVKTSLSVRDREDIARQVGLTLAQDKKSFVDDAGKILTTQVRELQLNADTTPEVLIIIGGSTMLFGSAGSGVQLYVKNARGRYAQHLGFPAADVRVLSTRTNGYRDLLILGPGFDCPVWRWDGKSYVYARTVKCP